MDIPPIVGSIRNKGQNKDMRNNKIATETQKVIKMGSLVKPRTLQQRMAERMPLNAIPFVCKHCSRADLRFVGARPHPHIREIRHIRIYDM